MGLQVDSVQCNKRAKHHRVKTGCLTCRKRRKKCDELRPTCVGCTRNHLVCAWPLDPGHENHTTTGPTLSRATRPSIEDVLGGNLNHQTPGQALVPSVLASISPLTSYAHSEVDRPFGNAFLTPRSSALTNPTPQDQRLLQHYIETTSTRLFAFNHSKNPFHFEFLPLASNEASLLHGLLALSGAHLSFKQSSADVLARSHYAISLRAAKYEITRVSEGSLDRAFLLCALLIILCHFETIGGDMTGALLTHLRAIAAILPLAWRVGRAINERLWLVVLEQFLYFAIVSDNVGLPSTAATVPNSTIRELASSIGHQFQQLNIQGIMFGRSGHIFPLFETIPLIRIFAQKPAKTSPRHLDPAIISDFTMLEDRVLDWRALMDHDAGDNLIANDDELAVEVNAGLLFQDAVLIFLRAAMYGPGMPSSSMLAEIEVLVAEFICLSEKLALGAKTRTVMLWPTLIVGSCARKEEHRAHLRFALYQSPAEMCATTSAAKLLDLLWTDERYGASVFGPYGLTTVARKHNISLSLG